MLQAGRPRFDTRRCNDEILSLHHCDQTGSGAHPNLIPKDCGGIYPGRKRLGVKLTTNLHLLSRIRMHGAVPPLPMSSWRGA